MNARDFFTLLCLTALVDKELQPEERPALGEFARRLGLDQGEAAAILREVQVNPKVGTKLPKDPMERQVVFRGVVSIVCADRRVVPEEEQLLRRIGRRFELAPEAVEQAVQQALVSAFQEDPKLRLEAAVPAPATPAATRARAAPPPADDDASLELLPEDLGAGNQVPVLGEPEPPETAPEVARPTRARPAPTPRSHPAQAARPAKPERWLTSADGRLIRSTGLLLAALAGLQLIIGLLQLLGALIQVANIGPLGLLALPIAALPATIAFCAFRAGTHWMSVPHSRRPEAPLRDGFLSLRWALGITLALVALALLLIFGAIVLIVAGVAPRPM